MSKPDKNILLRCKFPSVGIVARELLRLARRNWALKGEAMPTRDKGSALITASIISFVMSTVLPAAAGNTPTCNGDLSSTKVHGGIISVTAQKRWQPRGGEITVVIDTPADVVRIGVPRPRE